MASAADPTPPPPVRTGPATPSRPRRRALNLSGPIALLFTAGLCGLHGWAIWGALGGAAGMSNGWVPWRYDHPLYYYSALVTRNFLRQSWTTAGYDPLFMAGYPKSVVFPASSTLPELVVAFFGGTQPERAYKVYVLLSAAAVPWLVAVGARLWRLGPGATFLTVLAFLVYVWSDWPINYATIGMLPYLLAVPLGLVATGALVRWCEANGRLWWCVTAAAMVAVVLVHFTAAMFVGPAAALAYFATVRRDRLEGRPWTWRRHAAVWAVPVAVLALNSFWWLPGLWLAGTKGPSDFVFRHLEGLRGRLYNILFTEPRVQLCLIGAGALGLALMTWQRRRGTAALLGFVGAGFFWGYAASDFRSLDFLQPGRHTYAFFTGLCVTGAYGVAAVLTRLRQLGKGRLDVFAAGVLAIGAVWLLGTKLQDELRDKVGTRVPFMVSAPSARLAWVVTKLRANVRPGDRVLYEEGGFAVPGVADPFQTGRFSGIIPHAVGVEMIGGPYLHAALATNFTQFGENKLFGKLGWDRAWFETYARLYRPTMILCWTPHARAFCRSNPDLIRVLIDDGVFVLGRINGFEGRAIVGKAEVDAGPGYLTVLRAEGGLDGSVVLGYHSVPCLRSEPPVAWEPVLLEGDPVPFIKLLRPPPGPVTFTLRPVAPGRRGGPTR